MTQNKNKKKKKQLQPIHARFNAFRDVDTKDLITLTEWCKRNHVAVRTATYWIIQKRIIGYKFHRWYVHKNQSVPP